MRLYEIDEALENLLMLDTERAVDTTTGEILTAEQVNDLKMERAEKIEGCLLFAIGQKAEAAALKAEIDKLTKRKQACENKFRWIREYVQNSLNGEKFKTARVSVTYGKSTSVELQGDLLDVPVEYLKIAPATLNKTAAAEAIKAGKKVPGCVLKESQYIVIK